MKPSDNPPQPRVTRRRLLTAGAVIPIAGAAAARIVQPGEMPWTEGAADVPPPAVQPAGYTWLTPAEAAFVEAAVSRLIPADELGPGAKEAGVPVFIDRQLAGEYGRGSRWYMQGPWGEGEKTQGWQTRMTPAALYRAGIREVDEAVGKEGRAAAFAKLSADDQDRWLHQLEDGKVKLPTADAKTFFELLQQNTIEGFFSDPLYGGNRDMAGWKLIGFPGARYDHTSFVKKHGEKYPLPPVAILGRPDWNPPGGSHG
ncbi:gluconate 2-dehydrogenase subunit 3 family protein [Ramlibacter humi]|uniref:Gluconate 2-dehydrogenase subunit 3 family protein n=1 Tax=Ramlibacter humi TaxID=2530451 RepID=A0A4Z0BD22_9BURK|nr:gluconate 2-dehydrogenase subunit 3 family protein [Ramlibacter humi]TFY97196.1 gluconate 2-dehydrogenase subunit 3 family protein [Ramlibacter humi]